MNEIIELAQKIETAKEVRFNNKKKEIEIEEKDGAIIGVKEWLFQTANEYRTVLEEMKRLSAQKGETKQQETKTKYKTIFVSGPVGALDLEEYLNNDYDVAHSETCSNGILVVLEKEVPLED